MIRCGVAPFLECSTVGDRRLSAFVATVDGRSIEETYQAAKVLEDGRTGLGWRVAKGRKAVNAVECAELYSWLWDRYIAEHPELLAWIRKWPGLSDRFGREGRCCQAVELWRIRNAPDKMSSDGEHQ